MQRNPIRYDSEGEELDEEDEDSEADAVAAEENPFSGIALESRTFTTVCKVIATYSRFFLPLQRCFALLNTLPNYQSTRRCPTLTTHTLWSK